MTETGDKILGKWTQVTDIPVLLVTQKATDSGTGSLSKGSFY